jgi:hypothetical protein
MHGLFLIAKVDQSFTMNPLHIHDIADVNTRAHLSISHPFSIENHCTGSDPVIHKNKIHFFHQQIQKANPHSSINLYPDRYTSKCSWFIRAASANVS